MSATMKLCILLIAQIVAAFSELPPIKKCKITDSSCLKAVAQNALPAFVAGIRDIGTEVLDPMKVDIIKVDLAGLKMNLDNVIVKGLKRAVIDKISVNMNKKQAMVSWDTDTLTKGHYKASGRLLILPITGDGDMAIKLKKLHVDMMINFDVAKNAEGKDYIELQNYKYTFDVKENAHFDVTGLFKGNKALSDTMLHFMNENWKLLATEFGRPMLEKPNKKIFETLQSYFRSQALDDIVAV